MECYGRKTLRHQRPDEHSVRDGGVAHETVKFALDGNFYEIDLSSKNAKKLLSDLAVFVEHRSRVSSRTAAGVRVVGPVTAAGRTRDQTGSSDILAFAQRPFPAERGLIKQDIVEAFQRTSGR
jgi:hypothetical protein